MRRVFQGFCAVITIGVLLCATGCGLLGGKELDRAAEGAGKLVTFYCENVTIPEIREQFRAAVNQHAAPHSVSVQCVQGGQPLIVTPPNATPAPLPNSTTGANMATGNPHEIARLKAREVSMTVASLDGEVRTQITEEQLRAVEHDRNNARQAVEILEKECTLLNERIRDRDTECEALRSSLQTVQNERAVLSNELTTSRAECAALAAEVARLQQQPETLQS